MADYLEHSERWRHHKTPTDKTGHWVGNTFHHGTNKPADCDLCEPSVDYTRDGWDDPRGDDDDAA